MVDDDCIYIQDVIYSPPGFSFYRDDDILKESTKKLACTVHLLVFFTRDAQPCPKNIKAALRKNRHTHLGSVLISPGKSTDTFASITSLAQRGGKSLEVVRAGINALSLHL